MNQYGRADVLRILRVPSRQLATWQRAGLVSSTEEFSFDQLVQLRKLRPRRDGRRLLFKRSDLDSYIENGE